MTSIEAYKRFELKLNTLDNATNIDISPGDFVLIFNEWQSKWMIDKYQNRSTKFPLDEIESLIVLDKQINPILVTSRYDEFNLPTDYFDYIKSIVSATKGNCTNRILKTHQVKVLEIDMYLSDAYNKPSFEYEETPVTLAQGKIQVYKTDFTIGSVFLTYYRYPLEIDIEGYIKVGGIASTNVNPELHDTAVNEIIDLCVLEVQRTMLNGDGFQLSADRVNRNN